MPNTLKLKIPITTLRALTFITQGHCKYHRACKLYDPENPVCTKQRGQAYGLGRYGGCYRRLEEERAKGK